MLAGILRSFLPATKHNGNSKTKYTSTPVVEINELTNGNVERNTQDNIDHSEAALQMETSPSTNCLANQPTTLNDCIIHICPNVNTTEEFPMQLIIQSGHPSVNEAKHTQKVSDSVTSILQTDTPPRCKVSKKKKKPHGSVCGQRVLHHIDPKGSSDNHNIYLEDGRVFLFARRRPKDYLMWCSYACVLLAFPFGLVALLLTRSSRKDLNDSNNVLTNSVRLKRDLAALLLMIGLIVVLTTVSTVLCLNVDVLYHPTQAPPEPDTRSDFGKVIQVLRDADPDLKNRKNSPRLSQADEERKSIYT